MPLAPPANTRPPRKAHELDSEALARWLSTHVPGCADAGPAELTLLQFKGGQSNPTYWIGVGDDLALVLRKKPPGDILPSAHAVEREHRVMTALAGAGVPVPETLGLCEDPAVLGTPFFVMRYVPGLIHWDPTIPKAKSPAERAAIYAEYVSVLAALHAVDYGKIGLGDYGKVGGYVGRQVERWSKQYEASRTSDVPAMERLMAWLRGHVPAGDETTLIHGDYRIDNLLFSTADAEGDAPPRALTLLDWELSTLGHPTSDLAYACMSYRINIPGRGGLVGVDVAALGIPTEDELVAAYCAKTGRARVEDWPYFTAFGLFRLAAIAQGVYKRSQLGNASSDDAAMFGTAVAALSDIACSIVGIETRPQTGVSS